MTPEAPLTTYGNQLTLHSSEFVSGIHTVKQSFTFGSQDEDMPVVYSSCEPNQVINVQLLSTDIDLSSEGEGTPEARHEDMQPIPSQSVNAMLSPWKACDAIHAINVIKDLEIVTEDMMEDRLSHIPSAASKSLATTIHTVAKPALPLTRINFLATYRTVLNKQELKELEVLELANDTVYYAGNIVTREGVVASRKGG